MAKYLVTIAEEVYYTFEIEAELEEEPDVRKWNMSALKLRDLAYKRDLNDAMETESACIDFLEITEV
jgi:hypothetical protein